MGSVVRRGGGGGGEAAAAGGGLRFPQSPARRPSPFPSSPAGRGLSGRPLAARAAGRSAAGMSEEGAGGGARRSGGFPRYRTPTYPPQPPPSRDTPLLPPLPGIPTPVQTGIILLLTERGRLRPTCRPLGLSLGYRGLWDRALRCVCVWATGLFPCSVAVSPVSPRRVVAPSLSLCPHGVWPVPAPSSPCPPRYPGAPSLSPCPPCHVVNASPPCVEASSLVLVSLRCLLVPALSPCPRAKWRCHPCPHVSTRQCHLCPHAVW